MGVSNTIAFFDSGVGGLPYITETRKLLPRSEFIYLADRSNFPYGEKTREQVIQFTINAVDKIMEKFSPAIVVIACNTASTAALDEVRKRVSIPVVGTVPAVKPAIALSKTGTIGILATERTVSDPYLDQLIERFATGKNVLRRGDRELVRFVEHELFGFSKSRFKEVASPGIEFFKNGGADVIVLACTHFLHISSELQDLAGKTMTVIDSRSGVAKRIQILAEKMNMTETSENKDGFYVTGSKPFERSYLEFARRFDLPFKGSLY